METGKRFSFQRRILFQHKTNAQRFFGVTHMSIDNWERSGANFNPEHRRKMIEAGINPLYQDGYGELLLPGFELENTVENLYIQTSKKNYQKVEI